MKYWLNITSGRGPEECCRCVYLMLQEIQKQAKGKDIKLDILDYEASLEKECFKSVLLGIDDGNTGDGLCFEKLAGTVQWISPSPFRGNHKRKNWYVGIEVIIPAAETIFSECDIRVEATKSSGPGGQHVNKTESAIRVIHLPTGLSAAASEERCQHMNRKLALARLKRLIDERNRNGVKVKEQEIWQSHNQLERGNPVKTFIGPEFKEK